MSFNGSWVKQIDPTTGERWNAVASNANGSNMVAAVEGGDIYRSSDYGNTWIPTGDPALNKNWQFIASNALGDHMIATAGINIYYSSDFGASWTGQANPLLFDLDWYSCASNAVGDVMIATTGRLSGDVYKSIDFGVTWTNMTTINGAPSTAYTCALSSSGQFIMVNSYTPNLMYISADFGATWNESTTQPTGTDPSKVKCDGSGQYAIMGSTSGMWWSHDYGVNWTLSNTIFPDTSYFLAAASNLVGDEMYSSLYASGIYKSIDYGETWTIGTDPEINTVTCTDLATFSHSDVPGALGGLVAASLGPVSGPNGFMWSYYNYLPPPPPPVICFKEGSTLLSLANGKEQYIPIQDIRTGTLIKTSLNGYVPVHTIGTSKLYNSGDKLRGKNRLYRLTKHAYPELTEDLIITGCHSVLVGELSEKQRNDIIDELGRIMVTDNKYRLMAIYDERADPYEEDGIFDIWHLALDHVDPRMNYGVYANGGLLVETTSQRMLKEFSGMTLV